jgi:hypothetical protein
VRGAGLARVSADGAVVEDARLQLGAEPVSLELDWAE